MALLTQFRKPGLLALAAVCCCAMLGEAALRGAGFRYPSAAERDVVWNPVRDRELLEQRLYQRDERQIWKPIPGAALPWAPGEHLDRAGFRGEELPLEPTPGTLRIAILGSDEALGVGLARELSWPFLLRQTLEEHGAQVEILCAAVEGSTLRQGLERWRADVRPYHPDLVLCTYTGEMESRAANCGCTDEQRIRDNCGHAFPEPRARPAAVPALLMRARVVQSCAWFADVVGGDYWTWRSGYFGEQRLRAAEDRIESAGARRVPWRDFAALLAGLQRELAQEDSKLLLFPIPGERTLRGEAPSVREYQTLLLETAREQKIPRLSALELFDGALKSGARVEDFYASGRLNEGGQRFLAAKVAKAILPWLPELKH
jgi:hypothetical protein